MHSCDNLLVHAAEPARAGEQRISGAAPAARRELQHAPASCGPAPLSGAAGHDTSPGWHEVRLLWLRPLCNSAELHIHCHPSLLAWTEDGATVCHPVPSQRWRIIKVTAVLLSVSGQWPLQLLHLSALLTPTFLTQLSDLDLGSCCFSVRTFALRESMKCPERHLG